MKKLRSTIIILLLFTSPYITLANDPPEPGGGPQNDKPPLGGGAPIGSGVLILLGLGAVYGVSKIYNLKKEELEK